MSEDYLCKVFPHTIDSIAAAGVFGGGISQIKSPHYQELKDQMKLNKKNDYLKCLQEYEANEIVESIYQIHQSPMH